MVCVCVCVVVVVVGGGVGEWGGNKRKKESRTTKSVSEMWRLNSCVLPCLISQFSLYWKGDWVDR